MRLSVSSLIATPQKLRLSPSASWYWLGYYVGVCSLESLRLAY